MNASVDKPLDRTWAPLVAFWLGALLGTAIGGSVFGVVGGPVGMIFGFFIAIIVGAPIHLAAFLLTVVGPIVRLRRLAAILAGSLTGAASAQSALGSPISVVLAMLVGGGVTFLFLRWMLRKTWLKDYQTQLFPGTAQFSLSETMAFLTVVAMVCGAGTYGYGILRDQLQQESESSDIDGEFTQHQSQQ